MSTGGTNSYLSLPEDFVVPGSVEAAVDAAVRLGFEFCVLPEIGRLLGVLAAGLPPGALIGETGTGTGAGLPPRHVLRPVGIITIDDFTPSTTWPPTFDGAPDLAVIVGRHLPELRVIPDDLSGAEIQELLRFHAEGMLTNSPKDACHFLDLSGLQDPLVTVWSAWDGDRLAGCGALKELDATHGEVKSMRTAPDHLGRGVGAAVLNQIVATARERSYERLSLETGTGDSFAAAVHLYERFGFERCGPFHDYEDNNFSRFFTLQLEVSGLQREVYLNSPDQVAEADLLTEIHFPIDSEEGQS